MKPSTMRLLAFWLGAMLVLSVMILLISVGLYLNNISVVALTLVGIMGTILVFTGWRSVVLTPNASKPDPAPSRDQLLAYLQPIVDNLARQYSLGAAYSGLTELCSMPLWQLQRGQGGFARLDILYDGQGARQGKVGIESDLRLSTWPTREHAEHTLVVRIDNASTSLPEKRQLTALLAITFGYRQRPANRGPVPECAATTHWVHHAYTDPLPTWAFNE